MLSSVARLLRNVSYWLLNMVCEDCGAALIGVEQCRNYFGYCMEKEFVDPEYFAVHHLTVAAYMLQHSADLSERGWREMRAMLTAFLIEGKTSAQMRVESRDRVDSGKRTWSLTKGPKGQLPKPMQWTRTIADVSLADAATYCRDVEAWARAVLADLERGNCDS